MARQESEIMDTIKYLREAASVERCHAIPHLGSYTVGHHTFGMLALLRWLHPEASTNLIWAIVEHDLPERKIGDIPHGAKLSGIINKEEMERVEQNLVEDLLGSSSDKYLNEEEKKWLAGLDMLDFFFWCKEQLALGNIGCRTKILDVMAYVESNRSRYPELVINIFYDYADHEWELMSDGDIP
jgi:hypothetical protein